MLVDAKYDQDVFRHDSRGDDPDEEANEARENEKKPADRIQQHQSQSGKNAGKPRQHRDSRREPIKDLDDRGGDESIPLKEVAKIEHVSSPLESRQIVRETAPVAAAGQLRANLLLLC